jgi:hypothetical protein
LELFIILFVKDTVSLNFFGIILFSNFYFSKSGANVISLTNTNTQLRSTNNTIQDTAKIIKFTGFCFKIQISLVIRHVKYLTPESTFFPEITQLFGLIHSILFTGSRVDIESLLVDDETKATNEYDEKRQRAAKSRHEFKQAKTGFIKEVILNTNIDTVYNMLLNNAEYFDYLVSGEYFNKQLITSLVGNPKSDDPNQSTSIDEYLIFYLVYLCKFDVGKVGASESYLKMLDSIFNAVDVCVQSLNMPSYLVYPEAFFSGKLDLSAFSSTDASAIEFYDMVLYLAGRILTSCVDFDGHCLVASLLDNLTSDIEEKKNSFSINKACDLEQIYKL